MLPLPLKYEYSLSHTSTLDVHTSLDDNPNYDIEKLLCPSSYDTTNNVVSNHDTLPK